jgi:hypothetical protein
MNSLGFSQILTKAGSRRIVQGSRKNGLNPQDLKNIRRIQG